MTLLLARLGIGFSLILLAFGPWLLAGSDPWYVSLLAWPWLATIICWLLLPLGGSGLPVRGGTILVCLLGLMAVTLFQTLPIPPDLARLLSPALQSRLALLVPENAENAWVTLSADPSATFDLFTRMAAITLLYQATRGLMVCAGGVFALAVTGWVLLVNGALLSLVAIAQSVTSAPDVVYWTWLTPGRVFGPFVCKNHYPYYMSMALGSAFGSASCRAWCGSWPDSHDCLHPNVDVAWRCSGIYCVAFSHGLGCSSRVASLDGYWGIATVCFGISATDRPVELVWYVSGGSAFGDAHKTGNVSR